MRTLALLALALPACCISGLFGGSDSDSVLPESEADADADGDSDADGDADSDADTDHTFPPEEPSFDALLGTDAFSADDGYWFDNSHSGYVLGTAEAGSAQFKLEIEGNSTFAGTYPVGEVQYTQTEAHAVLFRWQGRGNGVTFTVEGHDSGLEYIWGSLDAPITLTDTVSGASASLEELVVVSWPKF